MKRVLPVATALLLAANTIYQEIYNQQNRKGGEE